MISCGVREPVVIAEEATHLVTDSQRRRQMKRIERSQLPRLQFDGDVEDSVGERKQGDPLQPFPCVLLGRPAERTAGAYGLDPQQDA